MLRPIYTLVCTRGAQNGAEAEAVFASCDVVRACRWPDQLKNEFKEDHHCQGTIEQTTRQIAGLFPFRRSIHARIAGALARQRLPGGISPAH